MKKYKFRVIHYYRGDTSYYETNIKTWLGWVPDNWQDTSFLSIFFRNLRIEFDYKKNIRLF